MDSAPCPFIFCECSFVRYWTFADTSSSYNSVAHASISANYYKVINVNEAFTNTDLRDANVTLPGRNPETAFQQLIEQLHREATATSSSELEKLDNVACIQAYAQDYISLRSNLLIVSANENSASEPAVLKVEDITFSDHQSRGCTPDPYAWICPTSGCNNLCSGQVSQMLDNAASWSPLGNGDTLYCLSQRTPEHCKFVFSLPIVGIVITFNLVKAVLMSWLAFGMKDKPLMTMGDAVLSFLNTPDSTTRNRCLFSKSEFRAGIVPPPMAKQWHRKRKLWLSATSPGRVLTFLGMYVRAFPSFPFYSFLHYLLTLLSTDFHHLTESEICRLFIALITCAGLLSYGISQIKVPNISDVWAIGLGSINVKTIIQGWRM